MTYDDTVKAINDFTGPGCPMCGSPVQNASFFACTGRRKDRTVDYEVTFECATTAAYAHDWEAVVEIKQSESCRMGIIKQIKAKREGSCSESSAS